MTTIVMEDHRQAQRDKALAVANEVRSHRAEVKRAVKAGELHLWDVLADPVCATMRLRAVLLCVPRVGEQIVDRVLRKADISSGRQIGQLTDAQKNRLRHELRRYPSVARVLALPVFCEAETEAAA